MPRIALTDRFIAGAKAKGAPQLDYFDAGTPGLALRVSANGVKTWSFIFTSPKDGKRSRMTLGRYPQTKLANARGLAIEARGHLDGDRDPREALAGPDGGMTVATLVNSYVEKYVRPELRRPADVERRFNKNVLPVIGSVRIGDLHRRDINRVIDPILKRGSPTEAARCFAYLRAMVRWGVARGDLDRNPMEGMRKPGEQAPRERVLTDKELAAVWAALPKALRRSTQCQRIVRLCAITAQRVGEVAGMKPDELDLKTATWTIPGARTKNGYKHSVPLSRLAVEIIKEAIADAGKESKYLFPNGDGDDPLAVNTIARTIRLANQPDDERPRGRFGIEHWRMHDLRRTAVSNMAQLGVAPIVLGHVINHRSVTRAGVTLSVYSHYDYAKEKRAALELWADRLAAIVGKGAADVISIKGGRR